MNALRDSSSLDDVHQAASELIAAGLSVDQLASLSACGSLAARLALARLRGESTSIDTRRMAKRWLKALP